MKIIFHNDDFGLTYGFNNAITHSFLNGLTTSTSVRLNGTAVREAIHLAKGGLKKIGLGLHLNITEGPTFLDELANSQGHYKYNFISYFQALLKRDCTLLGKIERELEQQIKLFLNEGVTIDHIDSQDHIHMIPPIFKIVCQLCHKYGIKYLRVSREPFYFTNSLNQNLTPFINSNILKFLILNRFSSQNIKTLNNYHLKTTDAFFGILHTDGMDSNAIKFAIEEAQRKNFQLIEILSHPACPGNKKDVVYTSDLIKNYANSKNRNLEYHSLLDKSLRHFLDRNKVQRITHREV